jgi:hypothetical protein
MRTLEEARRAAELGNERARLVNIANTILYAERIYFAAGYEDSRSPAMLKVEAFADEFRAQVTRELTAQVARIDDELRALGIEPGSIEQALMLDLAENQP